MSLYHRKNRSYDNDQGISTITMTVKINTIQRQLLSTTQSEHLLRKLQASHTALGFELATVRYTHSNLEKESV